MTRGGGRTLMDIFIFALRSCMGGRDMIQLSFPKASSVAFWCMSTSSLSVRFSIGSSLRGSSLTASSYPSPALSRVAHGMASLVSIFSFLDSKRRRKPSLERPARVGKCAEDSVKSPLKPSSSWFQVQRNIRRAASTGGTRVEPQARWPRRPRMRTSPISSRRRARWSRIPPTSWRD